MHARWGMILFINTYITQACIMQFDLLAMDSELLSDEGTAAEQAGVKMTILKSLQSFESVCLQY